MKKLINQVFYALICLTSIFILGIFIPVMISLFATLSTPATFVDCTTSVPFWIFTIIGWFVSAIYVNDILTEK